MKELNDIIALLLKETTSLTEDEKSAIYAGFIDFFEGVDKLKGIINRITMDNTHELNYELYYDIYFELVHHIKSHIEALDNPMLKALKEWESI
ncbi:MAG: hypothetical protein WAV76_01975 [Bacteroidota bacterium]